MLFEYPMSFSTALNGPLGIAMLVLVVVACVLWRWVFGKKKHMGKLGTTAFVVGLLPISIFSSLFLFSPVSGSLEGDGAWLEPLIYIFLSLLLQVGTIIFIFSWGQSLWRWIFGKKPKKRDA